MAKLNVNYLKQMLDLIGIGADRVQIHYCSAAEGAKFSELAKQITQKIIELGPNPLKMKHPVEAEGTS